MLGAVAATLLLGGCGGSDGDKTVTQVLTQTLEEQDAIISDAEAQQAVAVLEGIIDRDRSDPEYHSDGFRRDGAVSQEFIDRVDQVTRNARSTGAPGIDFDPFSCSQTVPDNVSFSKGTVDGDAVSVVGTFASRGGKPVKVSYTMIPESGGASFQLALSSCVPGA